MRLNNILSWIAVSLVLGSGALQVEHIERRQDNSIPASNSASASAPDSTFASASGLPTLGSQNSQSASTSVPSGSGTNTGTGQPSTATSAPKSGASNGVTASQTANSTFLTSSTLVSDSIPSPTSSAAANGTTSAGSANNATLPLQPHITPALAIGGVILLLTGLVYTLIGVKNRWVHVFLSSAFLTSLSITVLIVYVMNPPVSNAIQGAYFVGIFMTGIIFGAGALVFKEVTEGLGCLLGGFCLSMWFLTLKEGGLIQSTGGKAIFISVFCVLAWSLSFSHYTRAYGLIGSISFSGATVFVLGIDCFSCGGLKEFWLYIWNLNNNLFPLNTNTYPISRGTRVETIVIVLACIIGIISQVKLWKIVKDKQKQKDAAQIDDDRRREVVEAALGRHLERQNDRDRSQWEKQYGDRLTAKRDTILWTDAHGEKRYSKIKETELPGDQHSSSTDSLEMANMPRHSRSMYVTRIKRASMPVTSIPEVEEADTSAANKSRVRQKVLDQLEGNQSNADLITESSSVVEPVNGATTMGEFSVPCSTKDGSYTRNSGSSQAKSEIEARRSVESQRHLSVPQEQLKKKKRTFASLLSRSKDDGRKETFPSQEALIVPEKPLRYSRASSLAATLDFENEQLDLPVVETEIADPREVSNVDVSQGEFGQRPFAASTGPIGHQEPELFEENFDVDPEEFVRPVDKEVKLPHDGRKSVTGQLSVMRQQSKNDIRKDILPEDEEIPRPRTATSENEVLTKDALESMPSQLSHVVMSYRTNEWAKHISTAEAPIFEEPDPVEGDELESPTHLADPSSAHESKRSSLNQPLPPEVPVPVPSALSSIAEGIRINPAIRPEQTTVSAVVQPPQPIRTKSSTEASGLRSTSSPMLAQQALQHKSSTDELAASSSLKKQKRMRSSSAHSAHGTSPNLHRSSTGFSQLPPLPHSNSRLSLMSEHGIAPTRSNSQLESFQQLAALRSTSQLDNYQVSAVPAPVYQRSPYQGGGNLPARTRSDTRLQHHDSHQPLQRNFSVESQKRELMMADWRMSQSKTPDALNQSERHRQQMLMDRQQAKIMEEQGKSFRYQQEMAVDARMRSKDMQELHREAMRRLQAGANKTLS